MGIAGECGWRRNSWAFGCWGRYPCAAGIRARGSCPGNVVGIVVVTTEGNDTDKDGGVFSGVIVAVFVGTVQGRVAGIIFGVVTGEKGSNVD